MKKFLAIAMIAALVLCTLTGCVAATTSNVDDVDRPALSVKVGETELTATPEETEPAESVTAEDGSEGTPLDTNIYNPVTAGDTIVISAKTGSAKSVCYRINSGDPVVVTAATAEIAVDAKLDKLETYIIASNGLASNWATYFFEVK